MNKQKGQAPILILVGMVVILAVAGGAYYLGKSQTPKTIPQNPIVTPQQIPQPSNAMQNPPAPTSFSTDETTSWKTYTNTAFKYMIKYPGEWKIDVKGGEDESTSAAPYIDSPCDYNKGDLCSHILIEVGAPEPTVDRLEPNWLINLTGPNPDIVTNKITTKLNGDDAQGFEYFQSNYGSNKEGRLEYVLVSEHRGMKYVFTYQEQQKDRIIKTANDWQNKKVFDQILSTFKFL